MTVTVTAKKPVEFDRLREGAEAWPARQKWRMHQTKEKRRFAVVCCPGCNEAYAIGNLTHNISSTGLVTPSFQCIIEKCGYNEAIRLKDWVAF